MEMSWNQSFAVLMMLLAFGSPAFGQDVSEHRPVVSADDSQVVFMRKSGPMGDDWELFIAPSAGGVSKRLTEHEGWDGYAVFSPDGTRLMFERDLGEKDGGRQPHLLVLATGEISPLGDFDDRVSVNDWSTEHGLLVFRETAGQRDLYLLNLKGETVRQLTNTPDVSEHDARFSPDEQTIAFASGPAEGEGKTALESMRLSGQERKILVESEGRVYGVDWKPTGLEVAYTDAPDGENGDLYVIGTKSGDIRRLTTDESWDHMPMWNQKGDRILFTSYRSGSERMYWLDVASGDITHWQVD